MIKLSFTVGDDIDEFLEELEPSVIEARERKREKKLKSKKLAKKKKTSSKLRKLPNSNIIVPTSDEDESDKVISDHSHDSDEEGEDCNPFKNRAF